ncbi:MAG TPA: response regulator [Polyangiaceae bacterium]|nr:MAG: KDP operon transcriptional regulatory protein KdpE [Deltaproteobacteria bacterium ADurb.Bin207]HNZ20879.1 response regulator [Polyangiaceae bacterium]HOD21452.1 response regulator [Polyangiaceae bacterium]HOE47560.1 response regulator [Polyangiaceae bacterium]HOG98749.1 response regulator [Polyangiaceae bacterium]
MSVPTSRVTVVMVVEDDPVNRMLLGEVCRGEGYEVLLADDGEMALSQFMERDIDVILVDGAMPRMDGFAFSRWVRSLSDVPIIMVSASIEPGVQRKARDAGVTTFISKPFRVYELTRQIRAVMRGVSPSEPPGGQRRRLAAVLDRLRTSKPLRADLGRAIQQGGVCLVLRLENEQDVVRRIGRTGRDALLGYAGQGLEGYWGHESVYWTDSHELAVVVTASQFEGLMEMLRGLLEEMQRFDVGDVLFRYGAVRFQPMQGLDPDEVIRVARHAANEAGHRGEQGRIEEIGERVEPAGSE